jgi:hypothetical protein
MFEKRIIFVEHKTVRRKGMNERKESERVLISFDYALKRRRRNKANYEMYKTIILHPENSCILYRDAK